MVNQVATDQIAAAFLGEDLPIRPDSPPPHVAGSVAPAASAIYPLPQGVSVEVKVYLVNTEEDLTTVFKMECTSAVPADTTPIVEAALEYVNREASGKWRVMTSAEAADFRNP